MAAKLAVPTLPSLREAAVVEPITLSLSSPGKVAAVVGNSKEGSRCSTEGKEGLPSLAFAPLSVTEGDCASSSHKPREVLPD